MKYSNYVIFNFLKNERKRYCRDYRFKMVSDLFFPNPSGRSGSIPFHPPPLASTSTSSSTAKVPPRNFVNQKDFARKLRAPKSPFLPKKRVSLSGEVTEGIEKLGRKEVISMLEKNEQLLIDRCAPLFRSLSSFCYNANYRSDS
jgi:hypothetical protein